MISFIEVYPAEASARWDTATLDRKRPPHTQCTARTIALYTAKADTSVRTVHLYSAKRCCAVKLLPPAKE